MLPQFLLPETEIRESGSGIILDLGAAGSATARPDQLLITLGITHTVEQESIDIAILGSANGVNWLHKPVATFSQKFYCGTYQVVLDLQNHPDVRYLRAKWNVNRWGRGDLKPLFCVYLVAEPQHAAMAVGA